MVSEISQKDKYHMLSLIREMSHKKEWNDAIRSNIYRPRDCHTEWSKSDRERQILYRLYVESKKWYKLTHLHTRHILLKPGLGNFKHYFTNVWDECNCTVVWAFFGIAFLWDWNENWSFPVLWPLLSFPNLLAYWVQHFHSIIFQDLE